MEGSNLDRIDFGGGGGSKSVRNRIEFQDGGVPKSVLISGGLENVQNRLQFWKGLTWDFWMGGGGVPGAISDK